MTDWLGHFLRITPYFRGKGRLTRWWGRRLPNGTHRLATLPDGSRVGVQLGIPYERAIWLQAEEWDELIYLSRKLRPGEVFIDVGANIGLWTLVAASVVGRTGRVISFEPNPATHRKLQDNVSLNQRGDIVCPIRAAVSEVAGQVAFRCELDHNVSSIASRPGEGVIEVSAVALDDAVLSVSSVDRIAGMKLDTEGHELSALRGASEILGQSAPWLIVEFNSDLVGSRRLRDWPVYTHLTVRGYSAFRYGRSGDERAVDGEFEVRGYCNILFERRVSS